MRFWSAEPPTNNHLGTWGGRYSHQTPTSHMLLHPSRGILRAVWVGRYGVVVNVAAFVLYQSSLLRSLPRSVIWHCRPTPPVISSVSHQPPPAGRHQASRTGEGARAGETPRLPNTAVRVTKQPRPAVGDGRRWNLPRLLHSRDVSCQLLGACSVTPMQGRDDELSCSRAWRSLEKKRRNRLGSHLNPALCPCGSPGAWEGALYDTC